MDAWISFIVRSIFAKKQTKVSADDVEYRKAEPCFAEDLDPRTLATTVSLNFDSITSLDPSPAAIKGFRD